MLVPRVCFLSDRAFAIQGNCLGTALDPSAIWNAELEVFLTYPQAGLAAISGDGVIEYVLNPKAIRMSELYGAAHVESWWHPKQQQLGPLR